MVEKIELTLNLDVFVTQLRADSKEEAKDTAERVARKAREYVAEDSGDLKSTIRVEPNDEGGYDVIAGDASREIDYPMYVEYGQMTNPNYPAQPFMTPAAEDERYAMAPRLAERLKS